MGSNVTLFLRVERTPQEQKGGGVLKGKVFFLVIPVTQ